IVILLAYDLEIAKMLLAVLGHFFFRWRRGEGDALAVRRPLKALDAVLDLGELHRLTAVRWDGEDLVLVARTVAGEGQPSAIGRPGLVAGGLVASGELVFSAAGRIGDPNVRDEGVILEITMRHGIGDPLAVGGDADTANRVDVEQIVDGGYAG